MTDYQKSITINKPVYEVYAAITEQIANWWSDDLTGTTIHTGDEYAIAFGKTKKTFSIIEAIPYERVVWQCDKAYIDMDSLKNKAEWMGTKLIWTLSATSQDTTLNFLHQGLNKNFECYNVCEAGWDYFISSLHTFLTTGNGTPHRKQQASLA